MKPFLPSFELPPTISYFDVGQIYIDHLLVGYLIVCGSRAQHIKCDSESLSNEGLYVGQELPSLKKVLIRTVWSWMFEVE